MTDTELTEKLKLGDETAYRTLVDQSSDRIFGIAFSLLQNREDAEDITQEVFEEIVHSVCNFNARAKFSTWIHRIAVNKSLEMIRSRNRMKRKGILLSLFGREQVMPAAATEPFYHPGVKLENKERAAILFNAVSRLPENQRTAFTLHKTENFSYEEISEIMETSVSSVESLMFRAKQNLKKMLSEYYDQNEK